MSTRSRVLAYGSSAAVAAAGLVVAYAIPGLAAEVTGIGMFTLALGAILLVVFFEVGLSEDREREREEAQRRREAERPREQQPGRSAAPRRRAPRRPRRPG